MKQKKRFMAGLVVLVTLLIFSLTSLPAFAAEKVYRLKIQSAWPHGDKSMDLLKEFASAADKRSNGKLKITVFAAPEIVPTENLFGATKRGTVDMLHGGGIVWGSMIPVANVEFGLPGAFRVPEVKSFEGKADEIRKLFFERGFAEILREEYAKHDLHFLDIHVYGPVPVTVSKKPIRKCSDFEGMKLRADGLDMIYQTAGGAKTMVIQGEEVYMALKTGVVDAAEWDISCITGMKWHEVAPYWIRGMENDHAIGDICVNMKKWNALPDDIKQALRGAAKDYYHATVAGYKEEVGIAEQLIKEGKLHEIILDKECQDKYAKLAVQIMDQEAAKDPVTAKAIKIIKEWRGIK